MSADSPPAMVTQLDGEPVEVKVTVDMVKRGVLVAPAVIAVCALIWGSAGAWSAAFAIGLVLVNFSLSAWLIATTAKISLGMMMGATLFGYLIRLGLIMMAVLLVKDAGWISLSGTRSDHHRDASRTPPLGAQVRRPHPGTPRPQTCPPVTTERPDHLERPERTNNVLALEFPPINEILRWRDLFPTFNKVALIAVAASLISIAIFLLASRQDGLKAPQGCSQPRRDDRRVHRAADRHADHGTQRDGLDAVPAQPVRVHLPRATCPASSRSSTCRPPPASRSRCSCRCSCG